MLKGYQRSSHRIDSLLIILFATTVRPDEMTSKNGSPGQPVAALPNLARILGGPVHPFVEHQVLAAQPNIVWILLLFCVPVWLLTVTSGLAVRFDSFANLIQDYPNGYLLVFFTVQTFLTVSIVTIICIRYSDALWQPSPFPRLRLSVPLLLLLLLLAWHGLSGVVSIASLPGARLVGDHEQFVAALAQIHEQVWSGLAYGPSLVGVLCSSASSLTVPVLEEVVFTGLLANAVARRWGFSATVILVPLAFALVHLPAFGFGPHLLSLLVASAIYIMIRLSTGGLLYAVLSHLLVNCIIFLPKWAVAVMYFRAR